MNLVFGLAGATYLPPYSGCGLVHAEPGAVPAGVIYTAGVPDIILAFGLRLKTMTDVLCLGEILVDWVCTTRGAELEAATAFTKAPGGAPANVAVGLARQGVPTGFVGRVSADAFGQWLKAILEADGIDTRGTIVDAESQTRMAYVVTMSSGDRKLAEFSRVAVADARLSPQDLIEDQFAKASILHFGSISLIASPAADATMKAVDLAKKFGLLISYDPNVRLGLWPAPEACRQKILQTLHLADIVKINLDELQFLTGSRDLETAVKLQSELNIPLLVVTLDADGAFLSIGGKTATVAGFVIQLVEATGAGDGFVAGILSGLLPHVKEAKQRRAALEKLPFETVQQIVHRANAIGALACTRAGAIPALPTSEELTKFLETLVAGAR